MWAKISQFCFVRVALRNFSHVRLFILRKSKEVWNCTHCSIRGRIPLSRPPLINDSAHTRKDTRKAKAMVCFENTLGCPLLASCILLSKKKKSGQKCCSTSFEKQADQIDFRHSSRYELTKMDAVRPLSRTNPTEIMISREHSTKQSATENGLNLPSVKFCNAMAVLRWKTGTAEVEIFGITREWTFVLHITQLKTESTRNSLISDVGWMKHVFSDAFSMIKDQQFLSVIIEWS